MARPGIAEKHERIIRDGCAGGVSPTQIAERAGLTRKTVVKWARIWGLEYVVEGGYRPTKHKGFDHVAAAIRGHQRTLRGW